MANKWTPSAKLTLAIGKLEEQVGKGKLSNWGTDEHLAVIRYLVNECVDAKTGKLDKDALKAEFKTESAFLGYASNAKKMLIEFGTLPKNAATVGGYE